MNPEAFLALGAAFPEGLLLIRGDDGTILAANGAAGRLTGRSRSELTGARLEDLATDPSRLRRFLHDCSATRTMIPGRIVLRRPDGKRVDCRAEGAAIRPAESGDPAVLVLRCRERGEQDRFLLLNQKIDELSREIRVRMRLEREREDLLESEKQARQVAERANRLKDEFLATLSHELRTPLNAIMGWASMLSEGVGEEQIQRGLETIHRATHAQSQLIDDLLDVSHIVTGKLRLELRPINVSDAVTTAVDTVEPTANAKGVRLERLIDPDPGPVSGDPDRIQQVVWNLLSNAIKFTPRGGKVQVRVERVNSHVEIMVSDTGEGIEPDLLPHIFERFRQGERRHSDSNEGLGLGLSIVRHLVEAHGGQVHAFSEGEETGTTVTVTLPLLVYRSRAALLDTDVADSRTPGEIEAIDPGRLSSLRVLVVEDEPDSREMLTSLFCSAGAESRGVRTTAEALAEVEPFAPHVIVSDIELPGEDGYMLARKLRKRPADQGGRIPMVALTAFGRTSDRVRALDAGFQMHLKKPVEPSELLATVASLATRSDQPS